MVSSRRRRNYAAGLLPNLDPPVSPLPFLHISNGGATAFTNLHVQPSRLLDNHESKVTLPGFARTMNRTGSGPAGGAAVVGAGRVRQVEQPIGQPDD